MPLEQVCNVAGNATTVRTAEPPYSYNNRESRRAARQRAAMFAQLIDETDLDVVLASAWPGGWQSRIKSTSYKVCDTGCNTPRCFCLMSWNMPHNTSCTAMQFTCQEALLFACLYFSFS